MHTKKISRQCTSYLYSFQLRKNGLNVILADLDGVVGRMHLKGPFDQLNQYQLAQKVRARVLYITPFTRVVHFTLKKSVCCER